MFAEAFEPIHLDGLKQPKLIQEKITGWDSNNYTCILERHSWLWYNARRLIRNNLWCGNWWCPCLRGSERSKENRWNQSWISHPKSIYIRYSRDRLVRDRLPRLPSLRRYRLILPPVLRRQLRGGGTTCGSWPTGSVTIASLYMLTSETVYVSRSPYRYCALVSAVRASRTWVTSLRICWKIVCASCML